MRDIKNGDGYNALRVAILSQAVQDYYNALRRLDKVKAKDYDRECDRARGISMAEDAVAAMKRFFEGEWCDFLSDGRGLGIMRKTEEIYESTGGTFKFSRGSVRFLDFH